MLEQRQLEQIQVRVFAIAKGVLAESTTTVLDSAFPAEELCEKVKLYCEQLKFPGVIVEAQRLSLDKRLGRLFRELEICCDYAAKSPALDQAVFALAAIFTRLHKVFELKFAEGHKFRGSYIYKCTADIALFCRHPKPRSGIRISRNRGLCTYLQDTSQTGLLQGAFRRIIRCSESIRRSEIFRTLNREDVAADQVGAHPHLSSF